MSNPTLSDRLSAANNRPSGFDYMRLVLATSVILTHSVNVCYGQVGATALWGSWARPIVAMILPMFFALSGFLVAGSLERCNTLVAFAGLRLLRIFPALVVETFLSAILLGLCFTKIPLASYFSSSEFLGYFANCLGIVHFTLPGVFEQNAFPNTVNLQLWTLPSELKCYLAISGLIFIGIAQRPKFFLPFLIVAAVGLLAHELWHPRDHAMPVNGWFLILEFLLGVAAYLYRRRIPWSRNLAYSAAMLALFFLTAPHCDFMAPLPVAYLTIYLGLLQPKRVSLLFRGDYSYGIFLYGFPLQQTAVALLGPQEWYLNFAIAFPTTLLFASISWHFIEKPALTLRHALLKFETHAIALAPRIPGGRRLIPVIGL